MLNLLLILVFVRPFIASLAFPYLNAIHSGLLILFLIIWFISKGAPIEKIQPFKYPLLIFVLALVTSNIFSINKLTSLAELYKYLAGLLLFIFALSLKPENKIRLLGTICLSGAVVSLIAIYQYFFGFRNLLNYTAREGIYNPFILDYITRLRPFAPFVTPNTLAGYLIMIIPLSLANKKTLWFLIPLSFALWLTKSLGAFLSIFLAMGIYFFLKGKPKKIELIILVGVLLLLGVALLHRFAHPKMQYQPVFSTIMRLNYWRETWDIIKAHPFTGIGLGNLDLVYSRYAHNSYLQVWAEAGILGIIGLLWIIFESFKMALHGGVRPEENCLGIGLISASAAFLIHNFLDFSLFLPEVSLVWWIVLGLIISKEDSLLSSS